MTLAARHQLTLQRETLVRVAVRAAAKATAVGLLPVVCLVAITTRGPMVAPVAIVLIGVSALFVVGAAACEVVCGRRYPPVADPPPSLPAPVPGQVHSQAEARKKLDDLNGYFWERDQCGNS